MKCDNYKIKEMLTAYFDDALSQEEHELVVQHLSECSECLQELQEL
jgi:anti-sigma factor RsiW